MRAHRKENESGEMVAIYRIASQMKDSGLSDDFIVGAVHLAEKYEGARELFHLWSDEAENNERDTIIADLQEEIDGHTDKSRGRVEKKKFSVKEADEVIDRIDKFKHDLRLKIDKWGGISKLADATGIPQPSLSRFFNSGSMPRRATLFKIGQALGLSDKEVLFDFE